MSCVTDRHLARIAALLRKAEATEFEAEADAYLQAAQRLATLASVDLAVARAHTARREQRATPVQRAVEIGPAGKRGLRTYVQLFLAVARSNQVTCDIARDSARVFAYGFETDIDAVEALYASLVVQMVRSCEAFLASGAHTAELVPRLVASGRRVTVEHRPVHATTARINFQMAFAARIGARLAEAATTARAEVLDRPDTASGVALALRAKEIDIKQHYREHSTARGSWGGFRATSGPSELSQRAGDRAGRAARLGEQRSVGGARPALGNGA